MVESEDKRLTKEFTSTSKWIFVGILFLFFILFSLPFSYSITNYFTSDILSLSTITDSGPTLPGIVINGLIMAIVIRLIL